MKKFCFLLLILFTLTSSAQCIKRDFNVQNYIKAWDNVPKELMGDYQPTKNDKKIIEQRIKEKLNEKVNMEII